MKTELKSRHVIAFTTLLLLSSVCSSCSRSADTSGGGTVSSPPENTSANQSQQSAPVSPLPPPTGFGRGPRPGSPAGVLVNDYAHVFEPESKKRLESVLAELRKKSDIEFAVATVETTAGQPIYDYSLAVAKGWGIGPKDSSKGGALLLMLAIKDRQWRLQVGTSLEKDLPDEVCKELGEQSRELYQQGKHAEGIIRYVKAIIERLEGIRGFKLSRKL